MYYKEKNRAGKPVRRLLWSSRKSNRTSDEINGDWTDLHLNSKDYSFPTSFFISTKMDGRLEGQLKCPHRRIRERWYV